MKSFLLLAILALCLALEDTGRLVGITFSFGGSSDEQVSVTNISWAGDLSLYPPIPTNEHYGYSCIFAWRQSPPAFFVISGQQPTYLIGIDAISGNVTSNVVVQNEVVIIDISYNDADGLIYAFTSPNGNELDVTIIEPTTGATMCLDANISVPSFPRYCESGLTFSGTDPRFYFTVDTNVTDPDDGNQAIYTYDLPSRSIVAETNWSSTTDGSLDAFLPTVLPGTDKEVMLALGALTDGSSNKPLRLLSIDPISGSYVVLSAVAIPGNSQGPFVPSLGALSLNSDGTMAYTTLFDDSEASLYLASFNLTAASGYNCTLVPVVNPNLWLAQWIPM
jgi:hypothetical protein